MFDHNKSEKCQLPFAPFCLPCLYIVHIIMLIYQLISCSHIMFTQRLSKAWVIWGWENMAEQITKKGGKGTINIHKCLCICIYIYMCVCVCASHLSPSVLRISKSKECMVYYCAKASHPPGPASLWQRFLHRLRCKRPPPAEPERLHVPPSRRRQGSIRMMEWAAPPWLQEQRQRHGRY